MAQRTKTKAPARVPVTRERALATAIVLADAAGLGSLTMRRLAHELGIEAMSLYHHVANKEDILDGMVDVVFAEIELPPDDATDWKAAMRDRANSARAVLTRHAWAIDIMNSRSAPGPATLQHHNAVIGCCRRAGFSVEMAAHAFSAIDSYLYGFVLQQLALPFDDSSDVAEIVETMMTPFSPADYPYLHEFTTDYILKPGYSYGDEFAYGLDLVLGALEAAARKSKRGKR